jgi:nitrogen fixation/metabolism regulation signal transduction histidine kinase
MDKQVNAVIDLTTLVDHLPIAIFLVGRDGTILLSNRMAQQIQFVETRESKTQRFGDIIGCPNINENGAGCGSSESCHLCRVKTMIARAFAAKQSMAQFETNVSTSSMGVRSIRMTVTYIRVNERLKTEQEMCIVTVEDMTELKKKERMEAASETIGAICHEMNQPLQAIMGNVELLTQFQLEAGAFSKIEKIFSEMERIQSINSKLMNLTHYQTKPYLSTKILDVERSAG